MDFTLTEMQQMIRDNARDFAQETIKPRAAWMDEHNEMDMEMLAQLGELGYFGVAVPEAYGGAGLDNISYVLAMIEVSKACGSTGVTMSVNNSLYCDPILKFGNEDQKQRFLVPVASGKKNGAFALSEPNAGSDAGSGKVTSVRDGDSFIIEGTKNFITNGGFADYVIVFAMTDPTLGSKGFGAFIVEKGTPGFSVAKKEDKLGIRGSSTTQLVFENCRIPAANLLADIGSGFKIALATLDGGRIGIASQAIGIAEAALGEAIKYANEREQFKAKIGSFQALRFMIADMSTELEAARWLTLLAADMKDRGQRHTLQSAQAKLFASEAAHRITHKALQIHGGYGFVKEYAVERYYRDSRITEIYEGTSEIMRVVISDLMMK